MFKITVQARNTTIGTSPDNDVHVCSSVGEPPKIKRGSATIIDAAYGGVRTMGINLHHFHLVPGSEAEQILSRIADLPDVTILIPANSDLDLTVLEGTINLTVPVNTLSVHHKSTGEIRVGTVNDLTIINHYTGDLTANSVRVCRVTNTNTGNVDIGQILEEIKVRNTNAGNVEINHIFGMVNAINTGEGDVMIYDGRADQVIIRNTGNGCVDFDIQAKVVSATNQGDGRVYVRCAEKHDIKSRGNGSVAINTPL